MARRPSSSRRRGARAVRDRLLGRGGSDDGTEDFLGAKAMDEPAPALAGDTVEGQTARAGRPPRQRRRRELLGDVVRSLPRTSSRSWWVWRTTTATKGVEFLGVNERDDTAKARAWIEEFDVPYPSIVDEPGAWADDFAFFGLPDTYVIDAEGTIRWAVYGQTDAAQLRELIDGVLADAARVDAGAQRPSGSDRVQRDGAEERREIHDRVLEDAPRAIRRGLAPQAERPVDEDAAQHDRRREVDLPHVPDRVQHAATCRTARASRGRSGAASRPRPSRPGASARPPRRSPR